jgi:hypothetical protein
MKLLKMLGIKKYIQWNTVGCKNGANCRQLAPSYGGNWRQQIFLLFLLSPFNRQLNYLKPTLIDLNTIKYVSNNFSC